MLQSFRAVRSARIIQKELGGQAPQAVELHRGDRVWQGPSRSH